MSSVTSFSSSRVDVCFQPKWVELQAGWEYTPLDDRTTERDYA